VQSPFDAFFAQLIPRSSLHDRSMAEKKINKSAKYLLESEILKI
jgi:hypothetical protein